MLKVFKLSLPLLALVLATILLHPVGVAAEEPSTTVTFFDGGKVYNVVTVTEWEPLSLPQPPVREGWNFSGWCYEDGTAFDATAPVAPSTALYSSYTLAAPSFEISSLSFEYDGVRRTLGFTSITHPALDSGVLMYDWYKDGESLGYYGSSISILTVGDGGIYTCKLTFSTLGEVVTVQTPEIIVEVKKQKVALPKIPTATYTSDPIYPQIFDTGSYTVERGAYTSAGKYPITLTLRDAENYTFSSTDKPSVTVDFVIERAENSWISPPLIQDAYTGASLSPTAISRFGTPTFLFAALGSEEYTSFAPTTPGKYLMRAIVVETGDYAALSSSPVPFTLIAEAVNGISVTTPPTRLAYSAFDLFDPSGISVSVSYNSGRVDTVGARELEFSYQNGNSFLFGDKGIKIAYKGVTVIQPLTVLRAEYDLAYVDFSAAELVYDGKFKTLGFTAALPTGKDGIPLSATVVGGGTDAGEYELALVFSTESRNYNTPAPIYATLTVTPLPTSAEWSSLTFTFDSTPKLPTAHYIDVSGKKVALTPTGQGITAGKYTATVKSADSNYLITNPTMEFEILKADYDMSSAVWIGGGARYTGAELSVTLTSLPKGVSVIGYVNNKATNAGKYLARAAFSYDTENYNPPALPDYEWEILPAFYDASSISFSDKTAVYDGSVHYPICNGKMPVGKDGIPLEYTFSRGAEHVADGTVVVTVSFSTKSPNYLAPNDIFCYVTVTPKPVAVKWHSGDFYYTGSPQSPKVESSECAVSLVGGGTDAGEYTVLAVPGSDDYEITNPTFTYTIFKANNSWLTPPTAKDIFFGDSLPSGAAVLGGEVVYSYFSDAECTQPLLAPSAVGSYYLVVSSDGDNNYNPISSAPLAFSIIEIVPVELSAQLLGDGLVAFESVSLNAWLLNNNGTKTPLSEDCLTVKYQNGDSLRCADTAIYISYGDFSLTLPITVEKNTYDLLSVKWENASPYYDGTPKSPSLIGLPSGVSVLSYEMPEAVEAGVYTVSVRLAYDEENYHAPSLPPLEFVIMKAQVPLPTVPGVIYDGKAHTPTVAPSPLYSVTLPAPATRAGRYTVVLTLTDAANYAFEGSEASTAELDFVIGKRKITVTVADAVRGAFSSSPKCSFTVTEGSLVGGDVLTPTYRTEGGRIFADFDSLDYDITVIDGKLTERNLLSKDTVDIMMYILFAVFAVLLLVILAHRAKRTVRYTVPSAEGAQSTPPPQNTPPSPAPQAPTEQAAPPPAPRNISAPGVRRFFLAKPKEEPKPAQEPKPEKEPKLEPVSNFTPSVSAITIERADELISDSLARDLIRRDEDIETSGRRRGVVNVDTLSGAFEAGQRVDINILKSHSLIPYDTAYIKVLARGILDKPLEVYANDFSLSAVKMIALTGGRAIRVNTTQKKKNGKKE